jgi:hypothetical protein
MWQQSQMDLLTRYLQSNQIIKPVMMKKRVAGMEVWGQKEVKVKCQKLFD